jgi:hypothetical protein
MPMAQLQRVDCEFEIDQASFAKLDVEGAAGGLVPGDVPPHRDRVRRDLGGIARPGERVSHHVRERRLPSAEP